MKIDLSDPRVKQAIKVVQKTHDVPFGKEFEQIFENHYHCKIIPDPKDYLCVSGWLEISEEKYHNWFLLQFGDGNDS